MGEAIGAIAGLIGAAIAAGQNEKAMALRQSLVDKFGAEALPQLDKVMAQQLPPEMAARYGQMTQAKAGQSQALRALSDEVNAKGETVDDKAAYLRSEQATAGQEAGQRSAALRMMAARGLAGSGVEAALVDKGGQEAIDRGAAANLDEASQARSRMLAAVGQLGATSATARGQDMDALKAQDAITMFNVRARQEAAGANNAIAQQQYDNRMGRLSAQANAINGVASGYDRGADATRATAGGIGQAAITAGAAYDQYGNPVPSAAGSNGSAAAGQSAASGGASGAAAGASSGELQGESTRKKPPYWGT